jgi:hypothetical protein
MPTKRRSGPTTVHQLKISLQNSKPPIWRRVQVPSNITLGELHHVIQQAMGWYDCHLHQFTVGGIDYGEPAPEWEFEVENENRVRLEQVAPEPKNKLSYQYDFGDDWQHQILVEKVLPAEPDVTYPICLKGKRACPPEDCGGVWGYDDFLQAIQDPNHPEHETMLEWIGGDFDPEAFSVDEVNQRLRMTG